MADASPREYLYLLNEFDKDPELQKEVMSSPELKRAYQNAVRFITDKPDYNAAMKEAYTSSITETPGMSEVINDTAADIPAETRTAILNTRNSDSDVLDELNRDPKTSAKYYWTANEAGEIYGQDKATGKAYPLDVNNFPWAHGWTSAEEFVKDLADIAPDLVSGAVIAKAAAYGGLQGLAYGGPWGALGGAVAAGATAGGVDNLLRQAAGNYLGYNKGYDLGELSKSVGINALFGVFSQVPKATILNAVKSGKISEQSLKKIGEAAAKGDPITRDAAKLLTNDEYAALASESTKFAEHLTDPLKEFGRAIQGKLANVPGNLIKKAEDMDVLTKAPGQLPSIGYSKKRMTSPGEVLGSAKDLQSALQSGMQKMREYAGKKIGNVNQTLQEQRDLTSTEPYLNIFDAQLAKIFNAKTGHPEEYIPVIRELLDQRKLFSEGNKTAQELSDEIVTLLGSSLDDAAAQEKLAPLLKKYSESVVPKAIDYPPGEFAGNTETTALYNEWKQKQGNTPRNLSFTDLDEAKKNFWRTFEKKRAQESAIKPHLINAKHGSLYDETMVKLSKEVNKNVMSDPAKRAANTEYKALSDIASNLEGAIGEGSTEKITSTLASPMGEERIGNALLKAAKESSLPKKQRIKIVDTTKKKLDEFYIKQAAMGNRNVNPVTGEEKAGLAKYITGLVDPSASFVRSVGLNKGLKKALEYKMGGFVSPVDMLMGLPKELNNYQRNVDYETEDTESLRQWDQLKRQLEQGQ